ncbi:DUF1015 domain-containing protein [Thermosulfurimonas sp. F29]|uniref:DUF1015 domain-containing protein n=1 Tax=Thermosulfurimonas sp. F29 TaxID=2867247 RepID=UPI001C835924|nr:DUF1015 domain-containing protein [Thermosulfurimonas sp. F29]MBX6422109.1 DUF1015 domain-containing protein [Thermosulfurimonas sp. F29]
MPMPDVCPFYGWRYNPERVNLSRVVAPPYDVVSPEEVFQYLAKDPHNIFHLEISPEGPDRYQRAAERLKKWVEEGILIREKYPSFYLYRLHFSHNGQRYTRTGFIALVRLSPFSEGKILPHEKTFSRITEDRLRLLRATSAQFSQIFVLYRDPERETLKTVPGKEILRVEISDGTVHELVRIDDPGVQGKLQQFFRDRVFYIADGHHRYTTALRYAEEMEARFKPGEPRCFHYIMSYLCPFEDPGLIVLPTHRIVRRSPERGKLEEVLREMAESISFPPDAGRPDLEKRVFVIFFEGRPYEVRLRPEILLRWERENGLPETQLPAAWCARFIKALFGESEKDLKEKGLLSYTPWSEEVYKEASKGALGILLPPTPIEALERVASSGKVMPHKSTYFHPKILTGLVVFRITPEAAPPCP